VVELLTPFTAKGRQWKLVVVAGVQEGIWPNLRIRGSLLGSERLVERDRHPDLADVELEQVARAAVAEDELRLFYAATSRASDTLVVTAVDREEDQPSNFFDLAYEFAYPDSEPKPYVLANQLSAAHVVSKLRRQLINERSKSAAASLKALAEAGIAGADPVDWYGAKPAASVSPAIPDDQFVNVSPSGVEKFDECQLRWFLETHGGQDGSTSAQLIGNVLHKFAELAEVNKVDLESQLKLLEANWKLVDPDTGWLSRTSLSRATKMLERFYKYRASIAGERTFKEAEARFEFEIGRAKVRCTIDRIETTADGMLYIVDLKTGKSKLTKAEALTDAQMQIYQYAVGPDSAGASLLYLNSELVGNEIREQGPIDRNVVAQRIESTAVKMGGATFLAIKNKNCQFCSVIASCPIQIEGRGLYD
jgi:RecB family exonuclease